MAEKKNLINTFGIDGAMLKLVNIELSLQRILSDIRSDFIFAPHLNFIYSKAGTELIKNLKSDLLSGNFSPNHPITMEVPKSFRMRIAVSPSRLGPSFTRPGSILFPLDRLFYQILADQAVDIIDKETDHTRSFSHRIAHDDPTEMFLPTRLCWGELQKVMKKHSKKPYIRYILKN